MGVQVQWDNEDKTAILWTFIGRWAWGEYDDARQTANAMLETVNYKVDFIYDIRQMNMLPPDVVARFKLYYLKTPENVGLFAAVGVDTDLQLFWNIFTDLPYARHLKAYYFDTLDEARAFCKTKREDHS